MPIPTPDERERVFERIGETVTRIQKGESQPRAVLIPQEGTDHFTVRIVDDGVCTQLQEDPYHAR